MGIKIKQANEDDWGIVSKSDSFFRKWVPEWFTWLGWVLTLGALEFLKLKTGASLIGYITGISYWLVFLYSVALLDWIKIDGLPNPWHRLIYLPLTTIACAIALGCRLVAQYLAELVARSGALG